METLLDIATGRYGSKLDPDTDAGKILRLLTPTVPLAAGGATGMAAVGDLSLGLASNGNVSARPATSGDPFSFQPAEGPWAFAIVTRPGGGFSVEIELYGLRIRLPGLRPARKIGNDQVKALDDGSDVHLVAPRLLLIVEVGLDDIQGRVRIGPSRATDGSLEVTFAPSSFVIGPDSVLGFDIPLAKLHPDSPAGNRFEVPSCEVFVAPPGIAPLAMKGQGSGLTLELGVPGCFSGDLALRAAGDHAARPDFLKELQARVILDRGDISLLELTGTVELNAEITARLGSSIGDGPERLKYRLSLALDRHNPSRTDWQTNFQLQGDGGDGLLWRSKEGRPFEPSFARDLLGAYAVFAPLLSPLGNGDGYQELGLGAATATALATPPSIITSQRVTVYGAELVTRKIADEIESFLFFDVETDINIAVPELLKSARPLRVRQKSVGFKLDFSEGQLRPVFDPGKGFSLDLSDPGAFDIAEPLGNFLQPGNPRIARENPLVLELNLQPKTKLGVVGIDSATVRIPLQGAFAPSLTGLGAHLNVGVLTGEGRLKITQDGFLGSFDIFLGMSLGLRVSATLALRKTDSVTAVRLSIGVEWPIPIPIAGTGLGLFGILGLVAINESRDLGDKSSLQWYLASPGGDPAQNEKWRVEDGAWALGLGAVLGTLEGGYLINAKGLLVLELPGPRLALFMNANILKPRNAVKGTAETGMLLAVIEISGESLLIGVVARYELPFLISIEVPAEAYFEFENAKNWHLDIGSVSPDGLKASVRFMQFIKAEGYLMLHGNNIEELGLSGLAVATGIQAALTWGSEPIGLYIRVAASAGVGISFNPPVVKGQIALSGELHLFIVSIGVSANAEFTVSEEEFYVLAEVSGYVDFFFFEVSGSVTLALGKEGLVLPDAPPLLRGLSLHARSHALLPGSGVDGPIDGSLGDAWSKYDHHDPVGAEPPDIPIDAILVLQFEMTPYVGGTTVLGATVPERRMKGAWSRRGKRHYRYALKSIEIEAFTSAGVKIDAPTIGEAAPNAWWDLLPADPDGNVGDDGGAQLALLSWIPDATPAAALRTVERDKFLRRHWGTICLPVAPAAPVLWTFAGQHSGPSRNGWKLQGIPFYDEADHTRTKKPPLKLLVREPWRSGDPVADAMVAVRPGYLTGDPGQAARIMMAPKTGPKLRPISDGIAELYGVGSLDTMADAVRMDAADGLRWVRGLVFLARETGSLAVWPLNANGQHIGDEPHTMGQAFSQMPSSWVSEPWNEAVQAALDAWTNSSTAGGSLFQFELELPEDTAAVDIGMINDQALELSRWGLLVFEAITGAEMRREQFDHENLETVRKVVDGALGADISSRALLHPDAQYVVNVTYSAEVADADENGDPILAAVPAPNHTQTFRFRTAPQFPTQITSMVVATAPADGDEAVFYEDVLRVVFASETVRRIFSSYGVDLFVNVRASSGNHPPSPSGDSIGLMKLDGKTLVVGGKEFKPVKVTGQIYTPFESGLRAAVAPCVPTDHLGGQPFDMLPIPMKLEPMTGYVLDIEGKNSQKTTILGGGPDPLFRRSFTTSRYGTHGAFAAAIKLAGQRDRHISDSSPLTNLSTGASGRSLAVADITFQGALQAVDWGDFERLSSPRVTVLWKGTVPQPFAIYIETPESAWRVRGTPQEVADAVGTRTWKLTPQPWLELTSSSPAVTKFIHNTAGTQTLVLLADGARGQQVELQLERYFHKLFEGDEPSPPPAQAVKVSLVAAAWETR